MSPRVVGDKAVDCFQDEEMTLGNGTSNGTGPDEGFGFGKRHHIH